MNIFPLKKIFFLYRFTFFVQIFWQLIVLEKLIPQEPGPFLCPQKLGIEFCSPANFSIDKIDRYLKKMLFTLFYIRQCLNLSLTQKKPIFNLGIPYSYWIALHGFSCFYDPLTDTKNKDTWIIYINEQTRMRTEREVHIKLS